MVNVTTPEPVLPDIRVNLPEPKKLKRVIHRDEQGRVTHATEEDD